MKFLPRSAGKAVHVDPRAGRSAASETHQRLANVQYISLRGLALQTGEPVPSGTGELGAQPLDSPTQAFGPIGGTSGR